MDSETEVRLGAQAYKGAKFEEAISHFEKAIALDSQNVRARLYLATACAQQYIPGADTPDNIALAQRAVEQYRKVVDLDSSKEQTRSAVKGIAYLTLQMKAFQESRDWYRKAVELDREDPEPYYSIAVIDWTLTYQARQEERAKLGLKAQDRLPEKDVGVCFKLKDKNWANVEDGIDNLNAALQLRPDYDDAMAYLNLLYRERADVQCEDIAAGEMDLKIADEWVDKCMEVKKLKADYEESLRRLRKK
jgi:tetratricopeptide (TPR) repeat protein